MDWFFEIFKIFIAAAIPITISLPIITALICFVSGIVRQEEIDPSLEKDVKEARYALEYLGYKIGKLKVGYGELESKTAVAMVELKPFRAGIITMRPETKYLDPYDRISILCHEMAHIAVHDYVHGRKWLDLMNEIGEKCRIYEYMYIERNGRLIRTPEKVDYNKVYGLYEKR